MADAGYDITEMWVANKFTKKFSKKENKLRKRIKGKGQGTRGEAINWRQHILSCNCNGQYPFPLYLVPCTLYLVPLKLMAYGLQLLYFNHITNGLYKRREQW